MGRGLRLEDVNRGKTVNFEQTCVFYLIVRPSVGPGLRLEVEDVSRGKKMYFKAFGGSRVKTRRRISRQEDVF